MGHKAPAKLPRRIGRYNVLGRIATGGMAEVFLGRRTGPRGFQRSVAIKRMLAHLAREEAVVRMFLDEARIAARIQHPNVVAVEELDQDGEDLFMVMEYLLGESLAVLTRRLARDGRVLDCDLAAYVIAEAAAGLHAAHELTATDGSPLGVVHRDVSPQNIFITYDGTVKVLDFGIAEAADRTTKTDRGLLKGKLAYLSPEQVREEALDRRADVFGLGITLHEVLTGRRLFRKENSAATIRAVIEQEVRPPSEAREDVTDRLDEVCLRSLARQRCARYQTAAEMRSALLESFRRTGAPVLPESQLARLMEELFAERARAKRELVLRAEAGERVDDLVATLPAAPPDLLEADSELEGRATALEPTADAPRRRRRPLLLGLGASLVLVAALAVLLGSRGGSWAEVEPSPSPSGAAAASPAVAAGPGEQPTVGVVVRTDPPGALVELAGREPTRTPTLLRLPRSSSAVTLRLSLPGYARVDEVVVPDVDQRLRIDLVAEAPEPRRPRPTPRGRRRAREARGTATDGGGRVDLAAPATPPDRVELWD